MVHSRMSFAAMASNNLSKMITRHGIRPGLCLAVLALLARPALAEAVLPVEFVQVRPMDLTLDMALTGTVHARESVEIGFPQGG